MLSINKKCVNLKNFCKAENDKKVFNWQNLTNKIKYVKKAR